MKSTLIAVAIILIGITIASTLPLIVSSSEKFLVALAIPQNNSNVAGIEKYNIPPLSKNISTPILSAKAIFVRDLTSGVILYQKDADISLPIASTTKIMTALVASAYFKPHSELTVKLAADIPGSRVGLQAGEKLSFRSLLYGMLLNSGNDAAFALAENYPGGVTGFVSAMNKKAQSLNLNNTHFDNPAGFDSPQHYSSAKDLATITEEALKDPALNKIFATKETSIVSLDKKYTHQLANLNKLLTQVKGVLGVKTGYTNLAKENLVTLVDRDRHKILTVVLGSDDRFGESTKLIEWVYEDFTWPESENLL